MPIPPKPISDMVQPLGFSANIPINAPLSPDIEDRRQGQGMISGLGARTVHLWNQVKDDYQDSFNKAPAPTESQIGSYMSDLTGPRNPSRMSSK